MVISYTKLRDILPIRLVKMKNKNISHFSKRIRAVIHYQDLKDYEIRFLLGFRLSDTAELSGWEFIKGGYEQGKDKTLDDALYRELEEEAKIMKNDLIKEPKILPVKDAIPFLDMNEKVRTYDVEVKNNPSPKVIPSEEHCRFEWFNPIETIERLGNRHPNRLRDFFTLKRIADEVEEYGFFKPIFELYDLRKNKGYV